MKNINPFLAINMTANGLKCDAPGCGYKQEVPKLTRAAVLSHIGKPCPACGASLLTQQDANIMLGVILVSKVINALAFPLMVIIFPVRFFTIHKDPTYKLRTNGTGNLSIEKLPNEEQ